MISLQLKVTTKSQNRKAVAELASGDFEASVSGNNRTESYVAGPSKSAKIPPEKLDEIKTSLRTDIISLISLRSQPENQKEMLKLIAPVVKKSTVQNLE